MAKDVRYRLRPGLQWSFDDGGRSLLRDRALRRALRLGESDRVLATLLRGQGLTLRQLCDRLHRPAAEVARGLSGLARLYLLAGARSALRIELQAEQTAFAAQAALPAHEQPLHWLAGRDPPRHICLAVGACCSASFLGPMTDVDRARVQGLTMGARSRVSHGSAALETLALSGRTHVGMARQAGRCVAQGDDGLCDIHAEHGMDAKPVPCVQFPLRLYRSPRGVHVSLLLACEGYGPAREQAGAWADRASEVRGLLQRGATAVKVAVPVELSAGLPLPQEGWWALRDAMVAPGEVPEPDAREWLAAAIARFEALVATRQAALAEGPAVTWQVATAGLAESLRSHAGADWLDVTAVEAAQVDLQERALALQAHSPADALRLRRLAAGLGASLQGAAFAPYGPMAASAGARRHLADIVANDLQVQVALGHVDAGLSNLARRLRLCEAIACDLARGDGQGEVGTDHTTLALKVVYRSEPDVTALQRCERTWAAGP